MKARGNRRASVPTTPGVSLANTPRRARGTPGQLLSINNSIETIHEKIACTMTSVGTGGMTTDKRIRTAINKCVDNDCFHENLVDAVNKLAKEKNIHDLIQLTTEERSQLLG